MLIARGVIALATIACGAVLLVRVLPYGVRIETLPAIVLGLAMIALGAHRISLIARARKGAA
jgi:hypothetical protein